jgi:transcriptional regulator GlxA family with amidase domain
MTADGARSAENHREGAPSQCRTPVVAAVHGVLRGHVVTAVRVLDTRIAEPWTLNTLAHEVNLSRSQLVRAFDATVGMSPMACLRKMRAERMARLLVSTDLSIGEAARSVGWHNQFHASQTFHAAYGVSPTEFRRRRSTPPPIA